MPVHSCSSVTVFGIGFYIVIFALLLSHRYILAHPVFTLEHLWYRHVCDAVDVLHIPDIEFVVGLELYAFLFNFCNFTLFTFVLWHIFNSQNGKSDTC